MKTLILVRHGEYSGNDLNTYGKRQMEEIAKEIAEALPQGGTFTILASRAPRAAQSADVIAEILNAPFNRNDHASEKFWSDNGHRQDNNKFMEELEAKKGEADHVIVVSHLEYVRDLPRVITKDFPTPADRYERQKGSGIIIKFEEKACVEIG